MVFGFLKTTVHSTRHYVIVMAFAVVLGLSAISWYLTTQTTIVWEANTPAAEMVYESDFARSNPVRLEIPAVNIDTSFVLPLGLAPDQTVTVPDSYDQVGWYEGGATPGEVGPAVILGHVDSLDGPAIFYPLGQLSKGDEVLVTRDDGTTATFVVTKLQRYPQSDFPTMDVYGPTTKPALRLVTCTGNFNKGEQRYSHNLVVYAELKE
jgi:sortase (surface protein transpeptidase)